MMKQKHLISISDLSSKEILDILQLAKSLKQKFNKSGTLGASLTNKSLIMIFEKPSLRTRLSFEIGMTKLGGHAVYLGPNDIGMGTRESISDIANVASRMGEIIMARTFKHQAIEELAKYSRVPVINALSDLEHPCQTLADLLTMLEVKGDLKGLQVTFIGDGENNVTHSLCLASALLGINFSCAAPSGYHMNKKIVDQAKTLAKKTGASILETNKPETAIKNSDVVYTDTWVSMGDEKEKEKRLHTFKTYQVTTKLMKLAKKDAIFMHDLPAYRGNEVATEVIDGKQSIVFQQAENRMWAQMALILFLLDIKGGELRE
ncbi:MAG TPA: ornithine carbamoyltransferase [Candidatus Acidoferrales bacterium]|nr:ornithine carbamoyltransferase [Candidatus Acidoferrales bacterium]